MYVSKPFGGGGGGAKGDKIRIGCLTPAFWRAHKGAEMLRHPCILDDPQQRGQNLHNMHGSAWMGRHWQRWPGSELVRKKNFQSFAFFTW